MIKTLKLINLCVSNAEPGRYDSISYGKYYRDLTNISNTVIEEKAALDKNVKELYLAALAIPESPEKEKLVSLLKNI